MYILVMIGVFYMIMTKKRITVSFANEIAEELEKLANENGLSKSGLLTVLIKKETERKENEQKK